MEPCIEDRLIQLLRDSTSPVLSLRDLHGALAAEAGAPTSYALLEEWLRRRRDVFVVLETTSPLGDMNSWPPGTRSEYERELLAAGFDTGPHVSLVDPERDTADEWPQTPFACPDPVSAPLRHLRDSLLRIWQTSDGNASLRGSVAAALAGCHDLTAALREGDTAGADGRPRGRRMPERTAALRDGDNVGS